MRNPKKEIIGLEAGEGVVYEVAHNHDGDVIQQYQHTADRPQEVLMSIESLPDNQLTVTVTIRNRKAVDAEEPDLSHIGSTAVIVPD